MKNVPRNDSGALILYATTAAVVLAILVVGLWPFRFRPPNNVSWIVTRNGIRFGAHGSIVSSDQFRVPDEEAASPCSLEVWLAPAFSSASSTILEFSTPSNLEQFQLIQSLGDLFVNKERVDRHWRREAKHIAIVSLFQQDRSVFVSISGDSGGTSVFIDGALRRRSNEFMLNCELLTGTLILANSAIRYAPWQGNISALAIYRGSLDAAMIGRHYRAFLSGTAIERADQKNALAIYDFSERGGRLIRDQTQAEPDLTIPGWYSILYPPFLTPAWREFAPTRWYVTDLAINIAGFVAPGFFICATLISLRGTKRAVGLATIAGLSLSLTIEVLQAYIPMRNSGSTDLITNTLGAGIGAALYAYGFRHRTAFRNR